MIKIFCPFILLILTPSMWGAQQSSCNAPSLTDEQIKEIIAEKKVKNVEELSDPLPDYETEVRRESCNYRYIERSTRGINVYKINKNGNIIDIVSSNTAYMVKKENKAFSWCAQENELSEQELAKIVEKERKNNRNMKLPFSRQKVRVTRSGCGYQYWEENELDPANFNNFLIDPSVELMDARHYRKR